MAGRAHSALNRVTMFPDLAGGLAELARVTRPGSRVVVGAFGALPKAEMIAFFLGAIQATAPDFTRTAGRCRRSGWATRRCSTSSSPAGLSDRTVQTLRWEMPFESVTISGTWSSPATRSAGSWSRA